MASDGVGNVDRSKDKTQTTTLKTEVNKLEALVKIARKRASSGEAPIYDDVENLVSGLHLVARQQRYNIETEAAMREAREIMDDKIRAEVYDSAEDLFYVLDGGGLRPSG